MYFCYNSNIVFKILMDDWDYIYSGSIIMNINNDENKDLGLMIKVFYKWKLRVKQKKNRVLNERVDILVDLVKKQRKQIDELIEILKTNSIEMQIQQSNDLNEDDI